MENLYHFILSDLKRLRHLYEHGKLTKVAQIFMKTQFLLYNYSDIDVCSMQVQFKKEADKYLDSVSPQKYLVYITDDSVEVRERHVEETKVHQIESMVSDYFHYHTRMNGGYDPILTQDQYQMLDQELTAILNKYIDMNGRINKVDESYVKSAVSDGKHFV